MFQEAVLLIGGNLGQREELLELAKEALSAKVYIQRQSKVYESEAWGPVAKSQFLNQVLIVHTESSPEELLDFTQSVETALGRIRENHWGDRVMDIDILFFGERVLDLERLKVPHPYLAARRFTLVPLAELMPDYRHPVLGFTLKELLLRCPDKGKVWEFAPRPL
ncbi:2-amino-4-hydroxy-6-hydroxymethyldihydropteridine diphosphokinase [Algoriphagus namhaensis]